MPNVTRQEEYFDCLTYIIDVLYRLQIKQIDHEQAERWTGQELNRIAELVYWDKVLESEFPIP